MKKWLTSLLLFSHTICVHAEDPDKSNLLRQLSAAKPDTSKIVVLQSLEKLYFNDNLDSALYYNQLAEKLTLKLKAFQYQHAIFHEFVKIYHARAEYKKALDYCLKSVAVAKKNKNKFQEATSYRAIFNIYHNLRSNDSAVKYGVYSLRLTQQLKDTTNLAANFGNLSWLYMDMNRNDLAIQYARQGVLAGEMYKDTNGLLVSINNLARCLLMESKFDSAIVILKKQLRIAKKINKRRSVERGLINLISCYYDTGNALELEKSVDEFNKHLLGSSKIDPKIKAYQYLNNGFKYILRKEFDKAEDYLLEGLEIAETDSVIDPLMGLYSAMARVKNARHDFIAASGYERKLDDLIEKLDREELAQYGLDLEAKYQSEKKDAQLSLQHAQIKQKNILNYLLITGAAALLVILALSVRNYRNRQKLHQQRITELETEKQLTATEAVLKGEEQERSRLAKDLHDGLGGMLSGIKYSFQSMKDNLIMTPDNARAFERSMDMLDSSIKEMRRVAHNLMPEVLVKFGLDAALRGFCQDVSRSGALQVNYQSYGMENSATDQTIAIAVYRIVQELINNAIRHADASSAVVQVSKEEHRINVTVEDDGKGFDTAILQQAKGMGWSNIASRIEYLKGNMNVQSETGKGTSVYFELVV